MRNLLFIFIILYSILSSGQTEFVFHIKSDVNVDSVTLNSFNLSKDFRSAFINGKSAIKVPAYSSDQYSISIKNKTIHGWFNSGKIDLYLDLNDDELSIIEAVNTPVYYSQLDYFKKYKEFSENNSERAEFIKNSILENDQDTFVLVPLNHYLKLFQNDPDKIDFVDRFLKKQPETTKQHAVYSMIIKRLEKIKSSKQIELDEYLFITTDDKNSKIKNDPDLQFTVLDFWFTSCPPCIKEHKELLTNPGIFKVLNADLIGISTDDSQEKWVNYLEKNNIEWKNYRIGQKNLAKDLGIWSFPTYLILDNKNNVIGSYSNIEDTINALKK